MKNLLLISTFLLMSAFSSFANLIWTEVSGLPSGRSYLGSSVISSKMYAIAGTYTSTKATNNVYSFDGTNWTEIASLPENRSGSGVSVLSNKIYVISGRGNSANATNVYSFDGSTWTEVIGLPVSRHLLTAATLNNNIYAIGGRPGTGEPATNVYKFNGTSWTEVAGLPAARSMATAAILNGKLYVIAGDNPDQKATNNVYSFDGTSWTEVNSLPANRKYLASSVLSNKIYAIGGYIEGGAGTFSNVYSFDGTNWTEILGLPVTRKFLTSSPFNNKVYAIGGDLLTNVYKGTEVNETLKPINPIPTNTAINQLININLSWQNGGNADGYIINFGISNAMTNCGSTTTTNYNPGSLICGTNYQWRIDSTNILGITTGNVWSFSTRGGDWYVATNGTGLGTSWSDATNNLQGAINSCISNYTVWISNGTYIGNFSVGGGIKVRSKTGLPNTVILNGDAVDRVVLMSPSSWLIGCTITNGSVFGSEGAGIMYGSVSNCIITGNNMIVGNGGGAAYCTLYNSIISWNSSGNFAGGAYYCILYNCTVSGNSTFDAAGGVFYCALYNSISWNNNLEDGLSTNFYSCGVGYTGTGSITNDPLFVSSIDFHLQTNSPCRDTGDNGAYAGLTNSTDLDGNPRIFPVGGIVDMGAYEYNGHDWYVSTNGTGQGINGWTDATNNLQRAISLCHSNYTVWVSNGTYVGNFTNYGGITVRSKSGSPSDVILDGNATGPVVRMAASSWLIGCTVLNGAGTYPGGGGIIAGNVGNCIIKNNICFSGGYCSGGGAFNSTLYNCLIISNSINSNSGGGIRYGIAYNCTIANNIPDGVGQSTVIYNCISWNDSPDNMYFTNWNYYSCGIGYTGTGSTTNNPLFVLPVTNIILGTWTEVDSMFNSKRYPIAFSLGNFAYVCEGANTNVYKYDGTNWTEVDGMLISIVNSASFTFNNNAYIVGGYFGLTNVYKFDGTTWTEVAGLPSPRGDSGGFSISNNGYIAGGYGENDNTSLTNVYKFDGTNWTEVRGLPKALFSPASFTLNNNGYIAGGWSTGSGLSTNVYKFDGTTWTEVAGLPIASYRLHSSFVISNNAYITGLNNSLTNVYKFDGTTWTEVTKMPTGLLDSAGFTLGNNGYIAGGLNSSNVYKYNTNVIINVIISYLLQTNSPCRDTGDNGAWVGLSNSVDLVGNARIYNTIVDMGAYEWHPSSPATSFKLYGININKLYGVLFNKVYGK